MLHHQGTRPLTTPRLFLRRFVLSDEAAVYQNWASDPEVTRYLTWRAHSNQKITHDVLTGWVRHYTPKTYRWGIVWRQTGELIGSIELVRIDESGQTGDLGYLLSRRFWGQGILPEAAAAVVNYCFQEIGFRELAGEYVPENTASGKVLAKLQMRDVGIITGKYRTNQDEPCAVRRCRLLREEWETLGIRRACSHDVFEISALYDAVTDTMQETGGPGPGWKKGLYPVLSTARQAFERGELYAALRRGQMVGTMILNHQEEPAYAGVDWLYPIGAGKALDIHTLAVHPRERGRGIARAMLSFAEQEAHRRGCPVIRLDTHIDNRPAIRLYLDCGFRIADRIDLGIGETFGLYWFYAFEKQVLPPD